MIKSIVSTNPLITVSSYNNSPYINTGSQSAGVMRYNTALCRIEVYDGNSWLEIGGGANVDVSPDLTNVVHWAKKKMDQEAEYQRLAQKSPAVQDALEQMRLAESQLQMIAALVREDEAPI
jgi:hypothetical protein